MRVLLLLEIFSVLGSVRKISHSKSFEQLLMSARTIATNNSLLSSIAIAGL